MREFCMAFVLIVGVISLIEADNDQTSHRLITTGEGGD